MKQIIITINKLIKELSKQRKEIVSLKSRLTKAENKLREGRQRNTYDYFTKMNYEEKEIFLRKFKNLSKDELDNKLEEVHNWLKSKNITRTDYRATVSNWILRTHKLIPIEERGKANKYADISKTLCKKYNIK